MSVADPPAATDAPMLAVTPAPDGDATAASPTVPALPTCVVETLLVPEPPCDTVSVPGDAAIVKSAGGTVAVTAVAWVAAPSVPVTVTV